jgi:hypothetical protein
MLKQIARAQPQLFWAGTFFLALMIPCSFGLVLDERTFNGINVWIKPLKFQASTTVFLLTLAACFLALPRGADKTKAGRYVVWVAIVTAALEIAYITLQASRGQASHWNLSSPLMAAMYALMGIGALLLSSTALVQGVMIARNRAAPIMPVSPALRLGLALGLILSFILGASFGGIMSSGSGHWVGGTLSDAGGLPVFKWSRDGGDLRVAHFFGLHAMQFIPVFAWAAGALLAARAAKLSVWLFAGALCTFTVSTFLQAMQGRPFI